MNVLIAHPCKGFYGGAEEVVVQLGRYLHNNGHNVNYVFKDYPQNDHWDKLVGTVEYNADDWYHFWKGTRDWLQRADVVSVHNAPAPLMTFPKKVPTVYMCNEPMELFSNWKRKPIEAFNRWWVKKSGMKVVVADTFNAGRFTKLYGVVPNIIPYGVDYNFWSKGTRRKHKTFRMLQVGTITPYKNQEASLLALKSLLGAGVDATLTCIGGGNLKYLNYLQDKYQSVIPDNRWFWPAQNTQLEVRDAYYKHDILLHPVKSQGGWLVPFEALCAGLPIIVSEEFTGRDVILENRLGMIATDFTEMIKYAYDNYQETLQVAQIQREWVRDNLTWEKFGESMVKVMENAVNE